MEHTHHNVFKELFEHYPEAIAVMDENFRILFRNKWFDELDVEIGDNNELLCGFKFGCRHKEKAGSREARNDYCRSCSLYKGLSEAIETKEIKETHLVNEFELEGKKDVKHYRFRILPFEAEGDSYLMVMVSPISSL